MRARLMHASPRGVMVAVALSPDAIAEYLSPEVDLAAVNDPGQLRRCGNRGKHPQVPGSPRRTGDRGSSGPHVPCIPFAVDGSGDSGVHRLPVPPDASRAADTDAVERHRNLDVRRARRPIPRRGHARYGQRSRFSDELDVLLADPFRVLVEVGPGGTLTGSAMRHPRWSSGHRAVRLMRHQVQNKDDHATFLLSLGQLWSAGIDVDWTPLSAGRAAATGFASRLSLCAATTLGRPQRDRPEGTEGTAAERDGGGAVIRPSACGGHKRPVADGNDVAAHLGAVSRCRLGRPERQLLRTRRRLADRYRRRDDRRQRRSGSHTTGLVREPDRGSAHQGPGCSILSGRAGASVARGGGASPCSAECRTLFRAWVTGGWPVAHSPDPATSP